MNKNHVFLMLRKGITDGSYENGERLPPERNLAQQFGVARGTLREGPVSYTHLTLPTTPYV